MTYFQQWTNMWLLLLNPTAAPTSYWSRPAAVKRKNKSANRVFSAVSSPSLFILYDVSDQLRGSVSSLLQTVARDEDMSWARREQQALGRVPSRGGRYTVLVTIPARQYYMNIIRQPQMQRGTDPWFPNQIFVFVMGWRSDLTDLNWSIFDS